MEIDPQTQSGLPTPSTSQSPPLARKAPSKPHVDPGVLRSRPAWMRRSTLFWSLGLLLSYLLGMVSGYGARNTEDPKTSAGQPLQTSMAAMLEQVNPSQGYTLPAVYGNLGPQMAAAGVFDPAGFAQIYEQAQQPLTPEQAKILNQGSQAAIVFNRQNAYFLLNFFWAVGLSNQNPILDSGPIQTSSQNGVESLASTGGWTLAKKPVKDIFSSLSLIPLTSEQQKLVEAVAASVYRPCCDNPTHFPDCNHGMAMLGLLELLASQGASADQMLEAARYANAFWYPQQTLEQAIYFKTVNGTDFKDVDARTLLSQRYSSRSGFTAIHQYLAEKNLLPQAPQNGNSCGV